jgi:uncharacterized membrane protein YciS (DUF1049 family)
MAEIVEAIKEAFSAIIIFAFGFVVGAILTSIAYYKEKGK